MIRLTTDDHVVTDIGLRMHHDVVGELSGLADVRQGTDPGRRVTRGAVERSNDLGEGDANIRSR